MHDPVHSCNQAMGPTVCIEVSAPQPSESEPSWQGHRMVASSQGGLQPSVSNVVLLSTVGRFRLTV